MIVEKEIEERCKREIYQANVQFYRMIALRGTPIAGIILKSKIKEIYFCWIKKKQNHNQKKWKMLFSI